ncbi:MAG: glycosyltransferase family 4 protein [Immundisolibacteraceae bacterium]|nr:glycosyltransferase family 4 protein [Immundisolibacteraceae bacterium]
MDNPLSGGGPRRNLEIYRRLSSRHEITVLTPTFPGSTPEIERDGIRYVRLGRKIGDHGSSHHITFFFALPAAVRRFQHDLLIEDFMPPTSATLNPLFTKAPVIASVQWFYARALAKRYRMPFGFFEKHGLKLYKNFIVLTESMQDHIQKHQKEGSFAVIPNGVDDQLFELPVTPGEYIFYLGLIDFELKGVDLLLEAYARQSPASRLPLVLAGHCHDRKRLDERIAELKLGSSVQLLGKIDAQKRLTLMQNARFVCVPSRWETFCMVAAEACAAATPVIVFDIPPLNEVVPPQGCRLVPPFGVGQLASALEDLSSTPDATIIEMGQICRTFAQRYRWDIVAEAQENFFLEVVQKTTK